MDGDPINALVGLAHAAYAISDPDTWRERWPASMLGVITNPGRWDLMPLAVHGCGNELLHATKVLSRLPDLAIFQPSRGLFDPTVIYPGGSTRQPFIEYVASLLISAAQRLYFFREEITRESFTETVIDNYHQLRRQGRGEAIMVYDLVGFTGIELNEGVNIILPWGVLKSAPQNFKIGLAFNRTLAILIIQRTKSFTISRDEYPTQIPVTGPLFEDPDSVRILLPIAFAMASLQNPRCAPMATFEAQLVPFLSLNSYHHPEILFPLQPTARPTAQELADSILWAERLEASRDGTMQVAERRLVSALAQRSEHADSLIDAIISWESMVGTDRSASVKIATALAHLLESQSEQRTIVKERMQEIYRLRNKIVHGGTAQSDDVGAASYEAISIGLRALSAFHELAGDWLTISSGERARRLSWLEPT